MSKMTETEKAKHSIELGTKYPYDGNVPLKDWAHKAARGILADLSDRRGIKNELADVDMDVCIEMIESISEIIRICGQDAMREWPE